MIFHFSTIFKQIRNDKNEELKYNRYTLDYKNQFSGGDSVKSFVKEVSFLILQLLLFYVLPLFIGPTDVMGMVVLMLLGTFLLSVLIGCLSDKKVKYLYPLIVSALFIPSVFIYYDTSALVHSLWYLVMASGGIAIGSFIHLLIKISQ